MSIFDKFKKPKTEEKKKAEKKEPVVQVAAKEAIKKPTGFRSQVVKKEFTEAYRILRQPLVTEKSFNLSSNQNQYIFEVASSATKNEIKKIIQDLYGVKVWRVNIINVSGKKRRVGKHEGFKPGFKKAIVFLPEGEKIEVISR